MKKLLLAAAAALALAPAALASDGAPGAWYIKGQGGLVWEPDLGFGGADFEMDQGYNLGAAIGTNLTPNLALEGDLFYTSSEYSCCGTDLSALSLMPALIYTFDTNSQIRPFLGAGIGAVNVMYDGPPNGEEWAFGYQLLGGVAVPISDRVDFFAQYRWQQANDVDFPFAGGVEYRANAVSVGLKFALGGE